MWHLVSSLTRYPLVVRYICLMSILLFSIIGWWLLCYRSIALYSLAYASGITAITAEKKRLLQNRIAASNLTREIRALNSSLEKKLKETSASDIYRGLTWVIDCIHSCNVSLISCVPEKIDAQSWYTKMPFTFILEGDFHELMSFFKCVASSGQLIQCVTCDVKKSNYPTLSCTCTFIFLSVSGKYGHDT
jgi:Tfp pilus assembly protein PilO